MCLLLLLLASMIFTEEYFSVGSGPTQARSEAGESFRSGGSVNAPVLQTALLPQASPESNDEVNGESVSMLTGHAPEPPPMHPDLDPSLSTQGAPQLDHPSSQMPETDPSLAVNGHTLNDIMAAGTEDKPVLQQAFLRHIAELEREAMVIDSENEDIAERLTNLDVQSNERETAIRNHLKNLQVFIKQQIAEKQEIREREKKERRTRILQEPAPVLNTDGGVADSLGVPGGDLALKAAVTTSNDGPLSERAQYIERMRRHITRHEKGAALKGKAAKKLDRAELLGSLQKQMAVKQERDLVTREAELAEEKRFLEHINMEMDLLSKMQKADHLHQQRDLLASWERDGHLKNLKKLSTAGPRAVRTYAHQALLKPVASDPALTGRSTASSLGVGFDPRSSVR